MRKALLILPLLSHVVFAAHLLFHQAGYVAAAMPLLAIGLLFVKSRSVCYLQIGLMTMYALEWIRTDYVLVARRIAEGVSYHPALEILGVVALTAILSILPFRLRLAQMRPAKGGDRRLLGADKESDRSAK